MVELEAIVEEDTALEAVYHQSGDIETHGMVDIMHNMTRQDALRLKTLIEKHLHYTNSRRALQILDNWAQYLPRFVKVMPTDYRHALQQMENTKWAK